MDKSAEELIEDFKDEVDNNYRKIMMKIDGVLERIEKTSVSQMDQLAAVHDKSEPREDTSNGYGELEGILQGLIETVNVSLKQQNNNAKSLIESVQRIQIKGPANPINPNRIHSIEADVKTIKKQTDRPTSFHCKINRDGYGKISTVDVKAGA